MAKRLMGDVVEMASLGLFVTMILTWAAVFAAPGV
jgi:hypothetical protein